MPINRWMDKENVVYIHNGILLNHKMEWYSVVCSKIDGTGRYYAKRNKSDTERQISHILSHMWIFEKLEQNV
jgi:hypothetical protein